MQEIFNTNENYTILNAKYNERTYEMKNLGKFFVKLFCFSVLLIVYTNMTYAETVQVQYTEVGYIQVQTMGRQGNIFEDYHTDVFTRNDFVTQSGPIYITTKATLNGIVAWNLIPPVDNNLHVRTARLESSGARDLISEISFTNGTAATVSARDGGTTVLFRGSGVIQIGPGSTLLFRMTNSYAPGLQAKVEILLDDVVVYSTTSSRSAVTQNYNWRLYITAPPYVYLPPIPTTVDQYAYLGETPNWLAGVTAIWGNSPWNTIPNMGTIENLSVTGNPKTDADLSTNALMYDRIGAKNHQFIIKDNHSNNSTSPQYAGDNTFATAFRKISVRTNDEPKLNIYYSSGATRTDGSIIADRTPYLATGNTASGGEEGWTNQKLDVEVDSVPILGSFDTVLKIMGESNTISTSGIATFMQYHTQSPIADGVDATGVLTEVGVITNELSGIVTSKIKLDKTRPEPAAIYNGDGSFTDDSNDDLSGISTSLNPSRIAFSTVNGGEPAATEFTTFENIVPRMAGNYDVWVWATDKAGNKKIERVINDIYLEFPGKVVINKRTDKGATVHISDCPNSESVSVDGGCDNDCLEGGHIELIEGNRLVYELDLTNTDVVEGATGSFVDYLPAGFESLPAPTLLGLGVTNLNAVKETIGPNAGRWKITGDYSLAALATTTIYIECQVPAVDEIPTANQVISNQATLNWILGNGSSMRTGNAISNHTNHRVNAKPEISKEANWGAAIHGYDCNNSMSLAKENDCKSDCVAGNTGEVEVGNIITYKLIFKNNDESTQYFATNVASFFDLMPDGVTIGEQDWSVNLLGTETYSESGTLPSIGKVSVGGSWPQSSGNSLAGLTFDVDNNGITQEGNHSLSLASGAALEIIVKAKVLDTGDENLVNQVTSGYKLYGDSNTKLTTTNTDVMALNSNYVTNRRIIPSVKTKFTKVGTDDLSIGLVGAEFALYKWTGTDNEYTTGNHEQDIVDITIPLDGKWQRVKVDGEDTLLLTDIFVSDDGGVVDLGDLPSGTYTLIETKTAATYEIPMGQWTITVDAAKGDDGSASDWKIEFTGKSNSIMPPAVARVGGGGGIAPEYKVLNAKPFSIGLSGLEGTRKITIFGLTIMILAGSGYTIYAQKKNKETIT